MPQGHCISAFDLQPHAFVTCCHMTPRTCNEPVASQTPVQWLTTLSMVYLSDSCRSTLSGKQHAKNLYGSEERKRERWKERVLEAAVMPANDSVCGIPGSCLNIPSRLMPNLQHWRYTWYRQEFLVKVRDFFLFCARDSWMQFACMLSVPSHVIPVRACST